MPTILQGASEGTLARRPIADKWSALENIAHLARYHEIFRERINLMRKENRPQLARYRIGLVDNLSAHELTRTAIHSRFGEMTLLQWLEFFLLHEAHHLFVVMQRTRE